MISPMNEFYELGVKLAVNYAQAMEEIFPILKIPVPETTRDIVQKLINRGINSEIGEVVPKLPIMDEEKPAPTPRPSMLREKMRPIPPAWGMRRKSISKPSGS